MTRIALIHALAHSVAPINQAMARDWPEAFCMNLLDDSLSADLAAAQGVLDEAMTARFAALGDYAVAAGADGVLFTCSAFGPCIESVAQRHATLPVLKPNEAMVDDAVLASQGHPLGLIASFAPTLMSMPREFPDGTVLHTELAAGAMDALNRGDETTHDKLAADAAERLCERGCTVIALAQFSLARAAPTVASRTGCRVLTTVESAVQRLRQRVQAKARPSP